MTGQVCCKRRHGAKTTPCRARLSPPFRRVRPLTGRCGAQRTICVSRCNTFAFSSPLRRIVARRSDQGQASRHVPEMPDRYVGGNLFGAHLVALRFFWCTGHEASDAVAIPRKGICCMYPQTRPCDPHAGAWISVNQEPRVRRVASTREGVVRRNWSGTLRVRNFRGGRFRLLGYIQASMEFCLTAVRDERRKA